MSLFSPRGHDRCKPCQNFERHCLAHLEIFSRYPSRPQRPLSIPLHSDFNELENCGEYGCHLCRCWANSLLAECTSLSQRNSLRSSTTPISLTTPITSIAPLRSDTDSREAHYFEVQGMINTSMRLGGVSKTEFKVLMNGSDTTTSAAWAKERLELCHSSHSICPELAISEELPTRLLKIADTISIVHGPSLGQARYAALSYCWGGDQYKLTDKTEPELRSGIPSSFLSKTIQDAIKICRLLNISYIWVDALCIHQGDGSDWHKEANSIHHIYGNAYVTLSICSADSASDGFLHEQPSNIDPIKCTIAGITSTMLPIHIRKTLSHIRMTSPVASRGWIFQEELLSPRTIYWTDQGIFWSCSELKDAENGTTGRDELFPHLPPPQIMDVHEFRTNIDPLLLWDDMMSAFSIRHFTLKSDRLPALSGIARLIEQATGEEYLLGMWKSRLPAQLLWTTSPGPKSSPSWSWASVQPGRKIIMPKQATARAVVKSVSSQLHLSGRTRLLTQGLSPLWSYPDEQPGPRFPDLQYQPNIWAVNDSQILVCLNWRRPIIIQLDEMPSEFDHLICFEINYIGLLLLEPVGEVYRRIGCAQTHRESSFFDGALLVDLIIE